MRELVRYAGTTPGNVTYIDRPGATQRELLRLVARAKPRRGITCAVAAGTRARSSTSARWRRTSPISAASGRGLVKACDQLYYLHPGELERTVWLQMEASRSPTGTSTSVTALVYILVSSSLTVWLTTVESANRNRAITGTCRRT